MRRDRKGQSTLEYILVVAAVLVALIAVVGTHFRAAENTILQQSSDAMTKAAGKLVPKLGLQ